MFWAVRSSATPPEKHPTAFSGEGAQGAQRSSIQGVQRSSIQSPSPEDHPQVLNWGPSVRTAGGRRAGGRRARADGQAGGPSTGTLIGTPCKESTPTGFGPRKNQKMTGVYHFLVYMQTAQIWSKHTPPPFGAHRRRAVFVCCIFEQFERHRGNIHQPFSFFFF